MYKIINFLKNQKYSSAKTKNEKNNYFCNLTLIFYFRYDIIIMYLLRRKPGKSVVNP